MNDLTRGFDFLRVSLEAKLTPHGIITVTAARDDDGAHVVAAGLADAFADSGRRTLLVVTGGRAGTGPSRPNLSRLSLQQIVAAAGGSGPATLGDALRGARQNYDVVVVDAEALPESTLAYEVAREADGVIVAIRLGRKPGPEDRTTMKLLDGLGAKVLGIVPIAPGLQSIAASTGTRTAAPSSDANASLSRPREVPL